MIRTDKIVIDRDEIHLIPQPEAPLASNPGEAVAKVVDPKQVNVVGRSDMDFHILVN